MKYLSIFLALFMVAFILTPTFEHNVEYVVMGGSEVRFQYADGTPMSHAQVRVIGEHGRPIAMGITDQYGVFDYIAYFGTGARLEVRHEGYEVRLAIPEILPAVTISDRGVRLEIVVPAGSGGRLTTASQVLLVTGAAFVVVTTALLILGKVRWRAKVPTKSEIVSSRRMTPPATF